MIDENWKKIKSDNFKYQLWHCNFEKISRTDKEDPKKLVTLIGQYTKDGKTLINTFRNFSEAAEKTKCGNRNTIASCCKGEQKTSGKCVWKYLENQKPISKTIKEINEELNRNTISGSKHHNDIIYTLVDKNDNRKGIPSHRLIYQIYNEDKISGCKVCDKDPSVFDVFETKHDIDHIDGDHNNNHPENLQRLCVSCHVKKTTIQTKDTRKNCSIKNSFKIIAYKKDDENFYEEFDGISDITVKLQLERSVISKNIKEYEENKIVNWISSKNSECKYSFELFNFEEIEGEIWKEIPGFKNVKVSNKGRIKNNRGRVSYGNEKYGYMIFGGKQVSILIMKTFKYEEYKNKAEQIQKEYPDKSLEEIMNSNGKKWSIEVDHIDNNRTNNTLENLRWVTKIENASNQRHAKEIEKYNLNGELIESFLNISDASRKTGISRQSISNACNNKWKTAGNFIWKFKGND